MGGSRGAGPPPEEVTELTVGFLAKNSVPVKVALSCRASSGSCPRSPGPCWRPAHQSPRARSPTRVHLTICRSPQSRRHHRSGRDSGRPVILAFCHDFGFSYTLHYNRVYAKAEWSCSCLVQLVLIGPHVCVLLGLTAWTAAILAQTKEGSSPTWRAPSALPLWLTSCHYGST